MIYYPFPDPLAWMLLAMLAALNLFVVGYELFRKRAKLFDFLSLFHLHFVFYVSLPFVLLLWDFEAAANVHARMNPFPIGSIEGVIATVVGYACLIAGFHAKSARRAGESWTVSPRTSVDLDLFAGIGFLAVSAVATVLYARGFGGISSAITNASLIRSGVFTGDQFVFFKLFLPLAPCAALMFFLMFWERKLGEWSIIAFMLFCVSCVLSAMGLLMISGRAGIILFFANFYFFLILRENRFGVVRTSAIFVFAVMFILFGDGIFASIRYLPDQPDLFLREAFAPPQDSEGEADFYAFMRNLQHNVISLEVAFAYIREDIAHLRFLIDFVWGLVALLPARLIPGDFAEPETVQFVNTFLITGEPGISVIPPGMLAFGVYAGWWPGLILFSWAYGWVGRWLQELCCANWERSNWMIILFVTAGVLWAQSYTFGEPRVFLRTNIATLAFFAYLLFVTHRTERGSREPTPQTPPSPAPPTQAPALQRTPPRTPLDPAAPAHAPSPYSPHARSASAPRPLPRPSPAAPTSTLPRTEPPPARARDAFAHRASDERRAASAQEETGSDDARRDDAARFPPAAPTSPIVRGRSPSKRPDDEERTEPEREAPASSAPDRSALRSILARLTAGEDGISSSREPTHGGHGRRLRPPSRRDAPPDPN